MKFRKFFVTAAACALTALSAAMPAGAVFAPTTDASGSLPPAAENTAPGVPVVTFNNQMATAAEGGAVLGNSTQSDSAPTGDSGVLFAVAGLFLTAGIGTAAVALKSKKK